MRAREEEKRIQRRNSNYQKHHRVKELTLAELEEADNNQHKYPVRNSSYLMVKPTSDHSSHVDPSQSSSCTSFPKLSLFQQYLTSTLEWSIGSLEFWIGRRGKVTMWTLFESIFIPGISKTYEELRENHGSKWKATHIFTKEEEKHRESALEYSIYGGTWKY